MKSILDPSFHYTPSHHTDIRKTFARVRSEQEREPVREDDQAAYDEMRAAQQEYKPWPK